jgi:hypothetical protein
MNLARTAWVEIAVLLLALLPALSPPVTLRYAPPLNRPSAARIVNRMSRTFPGQPDVTMVQSFTMITTALSRRGGVTTVQTKAEAVKVDVPPGKGMEKARDEVIKATNGKVSTIVVDAYSVLKSAITPGVASTSSFGGFQGVTYPKQAVRIGETWSYELDAARLAPGANGAAIAGRLPMRYTLKGLTGRGADQIASISAAVDGSLRLNAQGTTTPVNIKGAGQMKVQVATGVVLSSRMTMTTTVSMGTLGTMRQRIEITMTKA